MRKLVLGIIAVICLDIAFIVYPGANPPAEHASLPINNVARQLNSITNPINAKAASSSLDVSMSAPETADATADVRRPAGVPSSTTTDRRRTATAQFPSTQKVGGGRISDLNAQLKPTIITIGNTNSTFKSTDRRTDSLERARKELPDDRSFISSVLPIVKKPFEWIKFLGSKLR